MVRAAIIVCGAEVDGFTSRVAIVGGFGVITCGGVGAAIWGTDEGVGAAIWGTDEGGATSRVAMGGGFVIASRVAMIGGAKVGGGKRLDAGGTRSEVL